MHTVFSETHSTKSDIVVERYCQYQVDQWFLIMYVHDITTVVAMRTPINQK